MKKLVVINLGSTSTKIAYFEDAKIVFSASLSHPAEEIQAFASNWDQYDYRKSAILGFMEQHGIVLTELDAFVSRGGHTEPVHSGVYRITPKMLEQSRSMKYGNHVSDLGVRLAYDLAPNKQNAFIVDSPCTDEYDPLSRYSGLPELPRVSRFHVLNQKESARLYCREHGLNYEDINLVVVHMGGGTSVAAHKKGRLVDGNNGLDGDGPFSTDRTGGLPVGGLIDMCYSGKYTHAEMRRKIKGQGGLMAYVHDTDVKAIEAKAFAGDEDCKNALDAMIYQTAQEIGKKAVTLKGDVNAIILTGGIAHSKYVTDVIRDYVSSIAPVYVYPGEHEMESLGEQSYEALIGKAEVFEL